MKSSSANVGGSGSAGWPLCAVCGAEAAFAPIKPGFSLRESRCPHCGAAKRTHDLAFCLAQLVSDGAAACLSEAVDALRLLRIHEAQAAGPLHRALQALPLYSCSEYLPDQAAPGSVTPDGVRCEDLQALSFADASLDVVVTQDVLEHVAEPWTAFREIRRVLRPGGFHVFTAPVHEGFATTTRTVLENSAVRHLLPPVHHGDPLRSSGSLVFTDFGDDLPDLLAAQGFPTRVARREAFYRPDEMPGVIDGAGHERYLEAWRNKEKAAFLRYNSVVFVSTRPVS